MENLVIFITKICLIKTLTRYICFWPFFQTQSKHKKIDPQNETVDKCTMFFVEDKYMYCLIRKTMS